MFGITVGMVLFIVIGSFVGAGIALTFHGIKNWYEQNKATKFWWD